MPVFANYTLVGPGAGVYATTDGSGAVIRRGSGGTFVNGIIAQTPLGRLGQPEEIARCVVFLAADDAGAITGSTLTINGGQYMV